MNKDTATYKLTIQFSYVNRMREWLIESELTIQYFERTNASKSYLECAYKTKSSVLKAYRENLYIYN